MTVLAAQAYGLAPARAERSAPRTIDQEVFENESPIAAMERPAAFAAHQLLVCGYRFGFDAHNLVLRAAGRTFERARAGGGHATPLIEWMRDRSNRRLRQLSLSQDQCVLRLGVGKASLPDQETLGAVDRDRRAPIRFLRISLEC